MGECQSTIARILTFFFTMTPLGHRRLLDAWVLNKNMERERESKSVKGTVRKNQGGIDTCHMWKVIKAGSEYCQGCLE
jgi:hypothetical protein